MGKIEIYYATTNLGKVLSLQRELSKYGFEVVHAPLELTEPRSSEVREIAIAKVQQAFVQIKKPTVALDAGFYINALNGFPRAFTNFALETIGLEGILNLVIGKSRGCEFRHCLTYLDDKLSEPQCFLDYVVGSLAYEPKGTMQKHLWSPLSQVFIPENQSKTLAEMSYDEYLEWRQKYRDAHCYSKQLYEWLCINRKDLL